MPYPKGRPFSVEHRRKIGKAISANHRKTIRYRKGKSLMVKIIEDKIGEHCILITTRIMKRLVRDSPTHYVICARRQCSEPIKIGDIVVPKGNNHYRKRKHGRKYYHTQCWESLFIDVED